MAGCGGGSSCDDVLNSRWSTIADILPVSGLAMGVYFAMLFSVFFIGPTTELAIRRLAWKVLLILSGSVAGSALWFMIVQKWIIGEFCFYCMTAHFTGLIIAILVYRWAIREPEDHPISNLQRNHLKAGNVSPSKPMPMIRPSGAKGLVFIGLLFAGILAVAQVSIVPSATYSDGVSHECHPVNNFKAVPMIGSPDAPYIISVLFDYECPHCQKIHFMLDQAVHRYDGKLAFALCPTPLNSHCNPFIPRDLDAFKNSCELARIGLAVWLANREAFPVFENWMYTFETGTHWQPRSIEAARNKAVELVGESGFKAALSNPWIGRYMQRCAQMYGHSLQGANGGIPKLILGPRWVIPEPDSVDDLILILQKSLEMPKP